MKIRSKKCWCAYPSSRCGNISCEDVKSRGRWYPHRTSIYLAIHDDEFGPATVICGNRIKFCPQCGNRITENPD